ncbi:MBL fold metallo-hydrolase [Elioraea rosea]|uniref:MBL fold metallo-hydrolase n=1 Tax=Elioraea rosea TaxID=2492390 RepID=UPI0011828F19|nr:MBL fold metallo-hydrolase [Elioraea rosea]
MSDNAPPPSVSRRLMLAAAATAPLLGMRAADAAAPFLNTNAPPFYRFRHGVFEITVVSDGPLVLPTLDVVLENAPKADVERILRENRMPTDKWIGPQNVVVVNTGRHLVLIDTGMGDRSKALGPDNGHLIRNLALAGIDPAAIDVVAITHAHIDHCWDIVDARDRLNFPNARVAIAMNDYEFWTQESLLNDPAARDFVLYTRTNLLPVRDRIIPVRDGTEVVPGITAMASAGHTIGHHSYVIESEGKRLVNIGDVFHHHVLLLQNPQWHNIFDSDKAQGAATRQRVAGELAASGTRAVVYHFPFPGVGSIARHANGFIWLPEPIFEG